jgi:signal transduction histidine kinase/CheY-like chemotaxis protein
MRFSGNLKQVESPADLGSALSERPFVTSWKTAAALIALLAGSAGTEASWALAASPGTQRPTAIDHRAQLQREVELSKAAMRADPAAALAHARTALAGAQADAKVLEEAALQASAARLAGDALVRLERPIEAMTYLDKAAQLAQGRGFKSSLQGEISLSRGRAETLSDKYGRALEDLQAAFHAFQRANLPRGEALALDGIGTIYDRARDYPRALEYYDQAVETYSGDKTTHALRENNRGAILKEMGRYKDAEAAFRLALADAVQTRNDPLTTHILTNIALAQIRLGQRSAAATTISKGLSIGSGSADVRAERPFLLAAAADLAMENEDVDGAAGFLDRAFQGVDLGQTSFAWRDLHALAALVYEKLGRLHLAIDHLRAQKRLDDAGLALAASTEAALMGARFDFANQKAKIAGLEADKLKHDVAMAQARARFALLIVAVVTIGGLILIAVMRRALVAARLSRNEIQAVNREIATANRALEGALNAKTEFLAMTSHEIRTPLNGILGMTQIMLAESGVDGELRSRLEVIRASGVTMNGMLTDLLDIAKIEKGEMSVEKSEFDLLEFATELGRMWSDQARIKGLEFHLELKDCPKRIVEDRTILRQILNNLLSNAVKFTSSGEVRFTVTASDAKDPRIVFDVSDTGIGIPDDQFDRVFEAFTQVDGGTSRAYGGTGLGLAICQNLSHALGGVILLKSKVEQGSTFQVDLPLVRALAPTASENGGPAGFERATLLIFEDNPLAQAMLRLALKERVRRLEFAGGLDCLRETYEATPDLILIDGGAIKRLAPEDPFHAIAKLRSRFAGIPMVALWPSMSSDDRKRLEALRIDAAFAKPIAAAVLADALESVYARYPKTPGLEVDAA